MKQETHVVIIDYIKLIVGIILLLVGYMSNLNGFLMGLGGFLMFASGINIQIGNNSINSKLQTQKMGSP